ncbi:S8 family serine peptidase [Virgibacillus sp. 179-BFC.A HS]|uniref:S8 family serine peptidase n=1 Tax=Tigheibacillus jepli TaxID=3035914 RepID=A0ABU5CEX5_9BACI|nr:S8 family serine peptidase [Virgibacillus sp. 179-BFC.A HS]MDY0404561.1 S8 family serine peptidase [Virgibacillus sp. 179-BFC.A HS]
MANQAQCACTGNKYRQHCSGGYEALQGTSMASPHVAGAVALIKEAHPNWSNDKIAAALETTAKPIDSDGQLLAANSQGMGEIQVQAAIHPETVIYNGALVFGKTDKDITRLTTAITIENTSNEKRHMILPSRKCKQD